MHLVKIRTQNESVCNVRCNMKYHLACKNQEFGSVQVVEPHETKVHWIGIQAMVGEAVQRVKQKKSDCAGSCRVHSVLLYVYL